MSRHRLLLTAPLAALLLASPAGAAVVRPVQAFDQTIGFPPVWTPRDLTAQPGDTIRWQFDQPGNPNASGASHDLHLIRPGAADEKLGVSYLNPVIDVVVDTEGTYDFYCSIHPDSMRGKVVVAAGEATPVTDPGRPWESPAPPVVIEGGPTPLLNSASPLTILEAGDTVAPTMSLRKLALSRRVARVSVDVSEPGTLFARILRGKKTVSTTRFKVKAGRSTVTVKLPKRRASYRVAVWARDLSGLESTWRYKRL
jgi:plastocyanin